MKITNYIMCIVWLCVLMFLVLSCTKTKETKFTIKPNEKQQELFERRVELQNGHPDYQYNSEKEEDYSPCLVRDEWYEELSR